MKKIALLDTFKLEAINQNTFIKEAKLIFLKYIQNYIEEANKQYRKLL